MYAPLNHIKRTGCLAATCLLLLLFAGLTCPAQNKKRLPDSIPTSRENTEETIGSNPDAGRTANADADADSAADTDNTANPDADSTVSDTAGVAIVSPPTFRAVPDSVISRWKKDKDFAYANDPAYWRREKVNDEPPGALRFLARLLSSRGFQYFIYFLLAGVLLFAIYKIIAENNLRLFYRTPPRGGDTQQELSLEEEDLDKGLEQALIAGDHRTATRFLYLKALRLLDAKGLIRYHPQATNQEYISQTRALPQGESFRFLTGAYERVWYGDFAMTPELFDRLLRSFQDFYKSISSK